jgi:hypothetical protein
MERQHGKRCMIRPVAALWSAQTAAGPRAVGQTSERPAVPGLACDQIAPARATAPGIVYQSANGPSVALAASPAAQARIAAGLHQVRSVGGHVLAYPSQDLRAIESADPLRHGQTHALTEHVGQDLAANVHRLEAQPLIRAAGGYMDEPAAQRATDQTIANPANQRAIAAFLADPGRLKTALARVDLGATVGTTTTRAELNAGHPALDPARTATVVLIKDRTFPEGYRVLTSYPDTRPPEVDARGGSLQ